MRDSTDQELSSIHEQKKILCAELIEQNGGYFIDLRSFLVQLDQVKLSISIEDTISGRSGKVDKIFSKRCYQEDFSISDPLFASHVQKSSEQNAFVRHGLLMVPSPSREFHHASPDKNMYVYYEINRMYYNENDPSYYQAFCEIKDISGNIIYNASKEAVLKKSSNTSRVEIIPLKDLPGGIYKITLTVSDLKYEIDRSVQRYFWVISSEPTEELVLPMEESDIKKYYDQIKYIATDNEKKIFNQLDARGKQEFILRFWEKRDPTPGTPTNEFMIEHFKKLSYIEQNFTDGIDSDRARIFMKYGPPLDMERYPFLEGESRPIEIWSYGINGNTKFVFVDRTRDGVYVLVHSNHPDEYSNPDWMEDIN
ncbi:MAG: GWxTD domain-containing protein [Calditrichaeota bacterium]|nr:GWxTD domain-containing protein [Calditrichota bacterium]